MELGQNYRFYPYHFEKDAENMYDRRGVSIKTVDFAGNLEKIERYLTYAEAMPTSIPRLDFQELRGKVRPTASSVEARTNFLYEELMRNCSRLTRVANTSASPTPAAARAPSSFPSAADAPPPAAGEVDDLPF
jgi:hypothetical protein